MDAMFPWGGEPPAPMLGELRGSEKRAINYLFYTVGELAMQGQSAKVYIAVVGTATDSVEDIEKAPITCDAIGSETPNLFEEDAPPDHRHSVEYLAALHGLPLRPSTWTVIEPGVRERVQIVRR